MKTIKIYKSMEQTDFDGTNFIFISLSADLKYFLFLYFYLSIFLFSCIFFIIAFVQPKLNTSN